MVLRKLADDRGWGVPPELGRLPGLGGLPSPARRGAKVVPLGADPAPAATPTPTVSLEEAIAQYQRVNAYNAGTFEGLVPYLSGKGYNVVTPMNQDDLVKRLQASGADIQRAVRGGDAGGGAQGGHGGAVEAGDAQGLAFGSLSAVPVLNGVRVTAVPLGVV